MWRRIISWFRRFLPKQKVSPKQSLPTAIVGDMLPASTTIFNDQYLQVERNLPDMRNIPPHVFIFNISEESFRAENSLVKLDIPGKSPNARYRYITSFPEKVCSMSYRCDEIVPVLVSGVRLAVDLISPDNIGTDLDAKISGPSAIGKDLAKKGVFYSLSNPPKEEDILAAERRLDAHCRDVIKMAQTYYWGTGKNPELALEKGSEIAFAAKRLGIKEIPWRRRKSDRISDDNQGVS